MTLYNLLKIIKSRGFQFVKHYEKYEIWVKDNNYVTIPNLNFVPRSITRDVLSV